MPASLILGSPGGRFTGFRSEFPQNRVPHPFDRLYSSPSIVTVSSVGALFHPNGPPITADAPVARSESAYGRSKAEAELRVRRLQEAGAPSAAPTRRASSDPTIRA